MHELALAEAIVEAVRRRASGREVRQVAVRIGYLRQVVPDSLQFSWEMLVQGTDMAGCRLDIDHVPAVVVCAECGATSTLEYPILMCPSCETRNVHLLSGEEFLLATMEVAEPAAPTEAH
jgi:hydrogenase nickel incorporation protein HypA/HybF